MGCADPPLGGRSDDLPIGSSGHHLLPSASQPGARSGGGRRTLKKLVARVGRHSTRAFRGPLAGCWRLLKSH